MKLKDLLKKLFPDNKEIDELEEPAAAPAPAQPKPESDNTVVAEMKNILAGFQAENKKLLDEVAEFKKKEADREKLLEDKAKADAKAKVGAAIKKAIEDKKIPAKDEAAIARYTKLLEFDLEGTSAVIDGLPAIAGGEGKKETASQQKTENNNNGSQSPFKVDRQALISEIRAGMEANKN